VVIPLVRPMNSVYPIVSTIANTVLIMIFIILVVVGVTVVMVLVLLMKQRILPMPLVSVKIIQRNHIVVNCAVIQLVRGIKSAYPIVSAITNTVLTILFIILVVGVSVVMVLVLLMKQRILPMPLVSVVIIQRDIHIVLSPVVIQFVRTINSVYIIVTTITDSVLNMMIILLVVIMVTVVMVLVLLMIQRILPMPLVSVLIIQ